MNRPVQGAQAVVRALRLMRLFVGVDDTLSLAQITVRSGLNRTTAFRLVRALEEEEWLEASGADGGYRLGPLAQLLGRRALGQRPDLSEIAQSILEDVATQSNETVTLEVCRDGRMVVIAEARGRHVLGAAPSLGDGWDVHATASGKVWLALGAGAVSAGRLARHTDQTLARRTDLDAAVEEAGRRGFALNLEELELGYVAVAVPLFDERGGLLATLALGGPKRRLTQATLKEWVPVLRGAADTITKRWTGDLPS